jgi:UDP-2,3-diacylglucosamine hydrolase
LLAHRSQAQRHQPVIFDAVRRAERVVLGGDIFDFRWSMHADERASLAAGQRWLETLFTLNPAAQFHYVLGNHDCLASWTSRLDRLAGHHAGFAWHEYYLLLNSTIFLHGDAADRFVSHPRLVRRRQRWARVQQAARPRHWAYAAAVRLRMHQLPGRLWHSPRRTARRIEHYLQSLNLSGDPPITQVVYGHTHRPVDGYVHQGVRYFNGGAPLSGTDFRVLEVQV